LHLNQVNRKLHRSASLSGCPLFFNIDFPWLFHDQKNENMAQHIFPSKRYTIYECIPELVVTVPSARSTIVKKIKRFIIWLYKWSRVTFTELLSPVVKIPMTLSSFSMTFPWLSMTFAISHDFPGLENGLPKFHDFPWPGAMWSVARPIALSRAHTSAKAADSAKLILTVKNRRRVKNTVRWGCGAGYDSI